MKHLIILLGVAGVSLSAVFARLSTAPSMVLVFYRVGLAALLLLPWVLVKHRAELRSLPRREALLSLFSGIFLGIHFAVYFQSLRYTSVAAAVVLVDAEVFFVALAMILVFRQKLPKLAWVAILLTFIGSVVVAMTDTGVGSNVLLGNLLALLGALLMAVYTLIGSYCRRRLSTTMYTFLAYGAAAVVMLTLCGIQSIPVTGYGVRNFLFGLGLAVFCTLLGHSLFSWGLKYLPAAFIATVKLLEPVFAAVWGYTLFGELPTLPLILGGAVIIFGIALYGRTTEET